MTAARPLLCGVELGGSKCVCLVGTGPDDIRSLLIAASMVAALQSVSDRFFEAESAGEPINHEQGMAILDEVLEFLRGGLEAIQHD